MLFKKTRINALLVFAKQAIIPQTRQKTVEMWTKNVIQD